MRFLRGRPREVPGSLRLPGAALSQGLVGQGVRVQRWSFRIPLQDQAEGAPRGSWAASHLVWLSPSPSCFPQLVIRFSCAWEHLLHTQLARPHSQAALWGALFKTSSMPGHGCISGTTVPRGWKGRCFSLMRTCLKCVLLPARSLCDLK